MKALLRHGLVFRHRIGYIDRQGKRHLVTPWRNNLILDTGLNYLGTGYWADAFTICIFGDQVSPDPVRRDSGAITFTNAGTTLTASGNFFVSQDAGRLIKFNDIAGTEVYISAFISATQVTLASIPAIVAETAVIWYVNQTAVQSAAVITSTYGSSGGDNGSTFSTGVATFKRTFIGGAVGAPTTLTEIGFSSGNPSANVDIFDRDIIPGGLSLLAGEQPLAIAELIISFNPAVPQAAGNVGTGYDTSGTISMGQVLQGTDWRLKSVQSNGNTLNGQSPWADVLNTNPLSMIQNNFVQPATANAPEVIGTESQATSVTPSAYAPGTFYKDFSYLWAVGNGTGTFYGLGFNAGGYVGFSLKFTTPATKTALQTLTVNLRKSWNRILTN